MAQAGEDLGQLTDIANVKVAITDYQTLPEGKTWLHQSWSGDLLGAAFYYMPKGVPPSVLSYWSPDSNGVVQNDFFCIGRTAKNPALAHRFIEFMLDEKNAYDNMVNFVGYTPPQNAITAGSLIRQRADPEEPHVCRRAPRPVRRQPGAAPAERGRRALLGRGLVEVQGGLMRGTTQRSTRATGRERPPRSGAAREGRDRPRSGDPNPAGGRSRRHRVPDQTSERRRSGLALDVAATSRSPASPG